MAKNLIEFDAYSADVVDYNNYNSTKTVLGPDIYKFTGATTPAFASASPTASPFGSPAPTFSAPAPVVTGFGGKAAPPPAFEPEL